MTLDLNNLSDSYQENFRKSCVILSFQDFLKRLEAQPRRLLRNSAQYLLDTFDYFGRETHNDGKSSRLRLFDIDIPGRATIIGCEEVQHSIYEALQTFCTQRQVNKLVMLHGPNGAAKTSIIDTIAEAMHRYSLSEEGCVYRFNWIFPRDPDKVAWLKGESRPIGFNDGDTYTSKKTSYATLDDDQISCKIPSEFRENPLYLLPMPQRATIIKKWIAANENIPIDDVELPPHVMLSGLSKRNQLIFENLLNGYNGNLAEVYRHVQVERFYFSKQYRVGIATVEPQMSIDAHEKQLTMERYVASLPPALQNFRLHESFGELVEANRGFLEFSDLLKRPIETFKYLLSTIEKSILSLHSGTMPLDLLFFATSNEKHLDAFKANPDFSSFRERFSLVTVPYLLRPSLEKRIYARDLEMLATSTKIAPHTIELLCLWGVMTRLKQPNTKNYEEKHHELISRLDPRNKVRLYEQEKLDDNFTAADAAILRGLYKKIKNESLGTIIFEGRFGISPRELKAVIYRAAQQARQGVLTVVSIFKELERMVKDRSVYEFLQFEPHGKYHDAVSFLNLIKDEFCHIFYHELLESMTLIDHQAYADLISSYVENVAGDIKKEKILDRTTGELHPPSQQIMNNFEKIIGIKDNSHRHREAVLNRLAAFKLDHPDRDVDLKDIFADFIEKIRDHYFRENENQVQANFKTMLSLDKPDHNLTTKEIELAEATFTSLKQRYGYSKAMVCEQLKFLIDYRQ